MGALEFISSDAYFAGGFVMKEPASVVQELFEYVADEDSDFERSLAEFESEHDIDIREDIASALGGEFAFALDGPVLPNPSWKLVVEVYDPARLQATLEWAAGRLNQLLQDEGREGFRTAQQESGGRVFHEIESLDTGLSVHYMFVDGYMVASASRALLERSLQIRDAGASLTRSPRFTSLMPRDGEHQLLRGAVPEHGTGAGPPGPAERRGRPDGRRDGATVRKPGLHDRAQPDPGLRRTQSHRLRKHQRGGDPDLQPGAIP